MELRQLSYFKIIAETENFSVAARRLNISQPYLSHTVRTLEEEFGISLFDRIGRRIRLNANGRILYRYAVRMLQLEREATEELQSAKNSPVRTLKLAMLNTTKLFPETIAKFCEEYPQIKFSITRFTSMEEIPDGCDLIIHTSDSLASSSNSFRLFEEECLLGMSPDHFLAKEAFITRDMLENATFLMLPPENTLGELTRQFFRQMKLTPPVSMQCDNQQTLAAFVEAGMGIAFFPSITWKIPDQGIILRKVQNHTLKRNIYLTVSDSVPSDSILAFQKFITENTRHPEEF